MYMYMYMFNGVFVCDSVLYHSSMHAAQYNINVSDDIHVI